MKRIREYHIESYWAEEALRREKRAEFKEKLLERVVIGAFIAFECALVWEFMRQLFEVI
jgi:hypothetical protein